MTSVFNSMREHFGQILVAAAGEADEDELFLALVYARECMSGLERRNDSFETAQLPERVQGVLVARPQVFGAAAVAQPRMLGADAGIVEAGRDRVRVGDLAVFVREHRRASAVEDGSAT